MSETKTTADQSYQAATAAMQKKLIAVQEQLFKHRDMQEVMPFDWGYVGAVEHWNGLLDRILSNEG